MYARPLKQEEAATRHESAKAIVDAAVDNTENEVEEDSGKNPAAVALGRLGGKKGGKAQAEKLRPERRREIAKKAA